MKKRIVVEEVENGFLFTENDEDGQDRKAVFEDDADNDGIVRMLQVIAESLGVRVNLTDDKDSIYILHHDEFEGKDAE